MAEAVEKLSNDFQCRGLVMDVVREITRLDSKELSRDTSGTKAFSQFLGAKYLVFFSSCSLKTREKYISFAQLVLLSLYIF